MADGNVLTIVKPTEEIPMTALLKAMQPDGTNKKLDLLPERNSLSARG